MWTVPESRNAFSKSRRMLSIDRHKVLFLNTLGCGVRVECRDPEALELLVGNYGRMRVYKPDSPSLEYTVSRCRNRSGFRIARRGREPLMAADDGEFLFLFEKDLTIELQKLRRDLYFVHAAALGVSGRAFLLVAASGKGKSMTTWALLHHGFRYLSDELGPLALDSLEVQPYPHAICLKDNPPWPYSLPDQILRTSSTVHIPTLQLPNAAVFNPMPLAAIFFLEYCPRLNSSGVRRLSKAEAAARLFVHALNPLAHREDGLAGAVTVAQNVVSFCLDSGELSLTCDLITRTLESAAANHGLPS
jgi:hypothetical protein